MTRLDQLVNLIESERPLYIQMHNSPDPDALSSAFGLSYLLYEKGFSPKICYKGIIDKFNTQRMIELLGIEVFNITELKDLHADDQIILVDSQKGNSNLIDLIGDEIASIDHHPTFIKADYLFEDIRPECGACATIIATYFKENQIVMPKNIASALLYGIKMDTLDLMRGVSELDLDTFCWLYRLSDMELINCIQMNSLQFEELKAYGNAIKNIKVYHNIGFANVGYDCPDSLLGTVSDFILSVKEVDFAIVYSPKNDGVKFSVRNERDELDAGKVIHDTLTGFGSGGGHKAMAGGFVSNDKLKVLGIHWEQYFEEKLLGLLGYHN